MRHLLLAALMTSSAVPFLTGGEAVTGFNFTVTPIDKGFAVLQIINWSFSFNTCSNTSWGWKGGCCICQLKSDQPRSAKASQKGVPELATPLGGLVQRFQYIVAM